MSIATKLTELETDIKNAYTEIENKGGTLPSNKNSNNLDTAIATIPTGITPTGTINITTNGETDVTNYATANVNVPTGGWERNEPPIRDYTFVDYDGTVLYSYTKEELNAMTSLPDLPTREGMTYQDWNWTLEDLKQQPDGMVVGALCRTSDNIHKIYLSIDDENMLTTYIYFIQSVANGFEIDWGDGSNRTKYSSLSPSPGHTYPALGDYVIKIIPIVSGATLTLKGGSSIGSRIGTYQAASSYILNYGYYRKIKKIELGSNVTLSQYAFMYHVGIETVNTPADLTYDSSYYNNLSRGSRELKCFIWNKNSTVKTIASYEYADCSSIKFISLAKGITSVEGYAFQACYSLRAVMLPKTVTSIGNYAFYYNFSLERTNLPEGIKTIGIYTLTDCRTLNKINIPSTVTSIATYAFARNYVMEKAVIPPSVTSIPAYTFYYCYGIRLYDFRNHTSVPTLANTNAFFSIQTWCSIVVPDELYDTWIAATNWSSNTIKARIVKASDYSD